MKSMSSLRRPWACQRNLVAAKYVVNRDRQCLKLRMRTPLLVFLGFAMHRQSSIAKHRIPCRPVSLSIAGPFASTTQVLFGTDESEANAHGII